MKFLRALVSAVGIVVAYALMELGGLWDVLGIVLFMCAVDMMQELTT